MRAGRRPTARPGPVYDQTTTMKESGLS
jgi:hypothetical protein